MKLLFCAWCSTIISPLVDPGWRYCDCKRTAIRWDNLQRNTITVWAENINRVRVIALQNSLLEMAFDAPALLGPERDALWRDLHEAATEAAEGYLYQSARRACWAVVISRDETKDITWISAKPDD